MSEETEYSFYKKPYSIGCPGCNRIDGQGPALDIVFENGLWRVHQDYVLTIPRMMVMELKRHVESILELTSEELATYPLILRKTREAMRAAGVENATFKPYPFV